MKCDLPLTKMWAVGTGTHPEDILYVRKGLESARKIRTKHETPGEPLRVFPILVHIMRDG